MGGIQGQGDTGVLEGDFNATDVDILFGENVNIEDVFEELDQDGDGQVGLVHIFLCVLE